jgi:AMP deaminase
MLVCIHLFIHSFMAFSPSIDGVLATELRQICQSFARCLELRDKYMGYSFQRLGDNPRDHDGVFQGFSADIGGVNGVRPDAWRELLEKTNTKPPVPHPLVTGGLPAMTDPSIAAKQTASVPGLNAGESQLKPWRIYPKPPPPFWHWKDAHTVGPRGTPADEAFVFQSLEIPGEAKGEGEGAGLEFEIDVKGVFQVYRRGVVAEGEPDHSLPGVEYAYRNIGENRKPVFKVPSPKEYFMDLDWVLGVVADGPTKTFAFRRLKYLTSKWNMYSLLNEHQELADMKVCQLDWAALLNAYLVGTERTTQVS